jgi:hypothetical protein
MKLYSLANVCTPKSRGKNEATSNELKAMCIIDIIESYITHCKHKNTYSIEMMDMSNKEVKEFIKKIYTEAGWKVSYFERRIILSI